MLLCNRMEGFPCICDIVVETAIDLTPLLRPEVGVWYMSECIFPPLFRQTTAFTTGGAGGTVVLFLPGRQEARLVQTYTADGALSLFPSGYSVVRRALIPALQFGRSLCLGGSGVGALNILLPFDALLCFGIGDRAIFPPLQTRKYCFCRRC